MYVVVSHMKHIASPKIQLLFRPYEKVIDVVISPVRKSTPAKDTSKAVDGERIWGNRIHESRTNAFPMIERAMINVNTSIIKIWEGLKPRPLLIAVVFTLIFMLLSKSSVIVIMDSGAVELFIVAIKV